MGPRGEDPRAGAGGVRLGVGAGILGGGDSRGGTGGCGRLWPLSTFDRRQLPHVHSGSDSSVFLACVTSAISVVAGVGACP